MDATLSDARLASEIRRAAGVGPRVSDTAFPEALERIGAYFFDRDAHDGDREPSLRWVVGLPLPLAYGVEEDDGPTLFTASGLAGIRAPRSAIHDRAVKRARSLVPKGFAPGEEPAYLDRGLDALIALPERVPVGETWIAYPDRDGGLLVLKEGASTTAAEVERLETARSEDDPFDRPVRVRTTGFARFDWPSDRGRRTDPGHHDPDAERGER